MEPTTRADVLKYFNGNKAEIVSERQVCLVSEKKGGDVKYEVIKQDNNPLYQFFSDFKIWLQTNLGLSTRVENYLAKTAQKGYEEVDSRYKQIFVNFKKDSGKIDLEEVKKLNSAIKAEDDKYKLLIKNNTNDPVSPDFFNEENVETEEFIPKKSKIGDRFSRINNQLLETSAKVHDEIDQLEVAVNLIEQFKNPNEKSEVINLYITNYKNLSPEIKSFLAQKLRPQIVKHINDQLHRSLSEVNQEIRNFDSTQTDFKALNNKMKDWYDLNSYAEKLSSLTHNSKDLFTESKKSTTSLLTEIKQSLNELSIKLESQKEELTKKKEEVEKNDEEIQAIRETVNIFKFTPEQESQILNKAKAEAREAKLNIPEDAFSSFSQLDEYSVKLKNRNEANKSEIETTKNIMRVLGEKIGEIEEKKKVLLNDEKTKLLLKVYEKLKKLKISDPFTIASSDVKNVQELIAQRDNLIQDRTVLDNAKKYFELRGERNRNQQRLSSLNSELQHFMRFEQIQFIDGNDGVVGYQEGKKWQNKLFEINMSTDIFASTHIHNDLEITQKSVEEVNKFMEYIKRV
ncbi:MAG: hypothetical protein H0T62_07595 [Parachlamydiaceae bacterium]|nr:hypothetical protein [Parachlamydiaceae bacterium]